MLCSDKKASLSLLKKMCNPFYYIQKGKVCKRKNVLY